MKLKNNYLAIIAIAILGVIASCKDEITEVTEIINNDTTIIINNDTTINIVQTDQMFANKSNLSPLVSIKPQFNYINAYSLISTIDNVDGFHLAGSADGSGLVKDGDEYVFLVNCEDHYSVARIRLDENLNPIKGDYLLNSGVADFARQCSATMWEAAIHGGDKDIFLSASESIHNTVKGIDPYIETPTPTADFGLPALGQFSWENAVPLPKDAYSGSTVIIGGDDDSSGSEGQLVMYKSDASDSDLEGGEVYVLRLKDATESSNEGDLDFGITYDVEFAQVSAPDVSTLGEYETASINAHSLQFMRVEDVDYGKGSEEASRIVYFNVTGRGPGAGTYNDWGTVYKLVLDEDSPMTGKLTQIISGNTNTNNNDGNLAMLQSPDNICVTENFIYIQEDPNSFDRGHPSYIYQSNLNGENPKVVLELVERNDLSQDGDAHNSGEFGALIDISDKIGVPDVFLLSIQPHYWRSENFEGLDGDDCPDCEDNQGSQIVILRGLPR